MLAIQKPLQYLPTCSKFIQATGEVSGGPQDRQLFRSVQESRQPPDALGFERRVMLRDAEFVNEHDQGSSENAAQTLPEAEEENEDQPRQESRSDHTWGQLERPSDIL